MALWRSSKFFRIMYCLRGVNHRTAHLCSVFKHSELLRSAKLIWKPSEWEVLLASHPQAALQQNRNQKTICTYSKPPGWKLTHVRRRLASENCQGGETSLMPQSFHKTTKYWRGKKSQQEFFLPETPN